MHRRDFLSWDPRGYSVQKTFLGCAANMSSKISLLVYEWPPYKMQNLVYEWIDFSKFSQIWAKIGSNLRKFWKHWVILLKIWLRIEQIGIWMSHFFLKKLVFVWVYFQIRRWHIPTKTKFEYPPGMRQAQRPEDGFSIIRFRARSNVVYMVAYWIGRRFNPSWRPKSGPTVVKINGFGNQMW